MSFEIQEKLEAIYILLEKRFDNLDQKMNRMINVKECLDGDKLLDNQDLCLLLGITKRTLARYRQKKLIPYYMIDKKTYYKSSEVQEFLKKKGG